MKIAVIADTHWGVRGDSAPIVDAQVKFCREVLFPKIQEMDVSAVIHLGDLMDRKKYVNYVTLSRMNQEFVRPMMDRKLSCYLTVGNHDCYYRDFVKQNSPFELLKDASGFGVFTKPNVVQCDGLAIQLFPWICKENAEESASAMTGSRADWAMGHLEVKGFGMYRGVVNHDGLDPAALGKFDRVLSGHYHHRSTQGNITYVGSTCQYTWSDHGDVRGFHVVDTDTREMTFVPNPEETFTKVFYDDASGADPEETIKSVRDLDTQGKFVKLVVKSKQDPFLFDRVVDSLEEGSLIGLQVVDDHRHAGDVEEVDLVDGVQDTMSVLKRHVDVCGNPSVKDDLMKLMTELYQEAISAEG